MNRHPPSRALASILAWALAWLAPLLATCADIEGGRIGSTSGAEASSTAISITEVLADPDRVPDSGGEWFEVHNPGRSPVDLRGWRIASDNDAEQVVAASVVVPAGGFAVFARSADQHANGGVRASYAYSGLGLANGTDWLVLRDRAGATVDSVAWRSAPRGTSRELSDLAADNTTVDGPNWQTASARFGAGDRGTPGSAGAAERGSVDRPVSSSPPTVSPGAPPVITPPGADTGGAGLTVRLLDVGQGDATYIRNGTSRILVDGGPDPARLRQHLEALGLRGGTLDVVVLSHEHFDHHSGLRELFRRSNRIRIRFFFENRNAYANRALAELRDSVNARAARGELVVRDTDDPCGDGRAVCTITLNGGARLHLLRPDPDGPGANNRSVPLKLVGPDSASFSMWLAGDAEHQAIQWFDTGANYDRSPGMRVRVLKADHHGSCNGITRRYLGLTDPEWVLFSVASPNDYGHVHDQTKQLLRAADRPWYRTDRNGTVTIHTPGTPGGGYTVSVQRGGRNAEGSSDRASSQPACNPLP